FATGNCLVVNNVFEHLRHSMLMQACANGNVFAYNYSLDPYWDEDFLPSGSAGDMVLHGNYPYRNLFEGNVAQNLVIDDSHGINGPNNAFLRNRLETYGIFMNASPATDSVIFAGNEITDNGMLTGMYSLSGSGHIEYANLQYDAWHPAGSDELDVQSWYRETAPCYYPQVGVPWPFCGPPYPLDTYKNPAQLRYEAGQMVFDTCSTATSNPLKQKWDVSVFPNPASHTLHIMLPECVKADAACITDMHGRIVKAFRLTHDTNKYTFSIEGCEPGLYVVRMPSAGIRKKLMIIP
ncbi:MAG TPA: T9SS type A sorting domain-containing protein, partial [Bacteroidales bacterium]|nr:T9SS type A sorting domain-containing protein [Bacteroidales bacterium]